MKSPPCRKVLMLEFNELCPSLLDKWMEAGELPNFRRFHEASQVFTTVADAEAPALEPWIQWYSIHTGLDYSQHRVFHLTDGPMRDFPDIWQLVRAEGRPVINFSSMNAKGFQSPGSVFLPDPWCTSEQAYPHELSAFFDFIARHVQEYSNKGRGGAFADTANFLKFLALHGLRPGTVAEILRYLAAEKTSRVDMSWKRVFVLDWIYRDVFLNYYKKTKPQFATIFLNSTAHLQHSYWRHMEPGRFAARPTPDEVERFGEAVLFGYKNMDDLLGDFLKLEAGGTMLVLASALSQQPYLKHEEIGGQRFYRPHNATALLARLGIQPRVTQPVMTHQYQLRFDLASEQLAAAERLKAVRCDGEALFYVEVKEDHSLYVGCQLRKQVPNTAAFSDGSSLSDAKFYEHFYQIDAVKSGRHHPDGVLWFRTGDFRVHEDKVPITDILPTLMESMGIRCNPSDSHPFKGRSLVPLWKQDAREAPAELRHRGEPVA